MKISKTILKEAIRQMAQKAGQASVASRFKGKSKKYISEYMSKVRAGKKIQDK